MRKLFLVLTVLVLMAASLAIAEAYDLRSFVEACNDFRNKPVSEITWDITQSELTWEYSKNADVIFVFQDNVLLSDRSCILQHSNGVVVNVNLK